MLRVRKRTSTPYFSVVFTFGLTFESFKEFGVHHMVSKHGPQNVEEIKNQYVQAFILINPDWELEFHVRTNAFQIGEGATLAYNSIGKFDQSIMYVSKLLN
jgi:hypothetical protein